MSEQTTALVKKAKSFADHLEKLMPAIKAVLPKHLPPDRFIKILRVASSQTPLIYDCEGSTINECIMVLAELGLDVSKARQHAALIPYRNKRKGIIELQVQVMYKGLIDIALRDGRIVSIEAHVVHKNDIFKCRFGSEPVLEHEPRWEGDPGDTIAAYAVARLAGGTTQWEVMTRAELDKVQKCSQDTRPDSAWKNWPDPMRCKSVIKRLCKYLPTSPALAQAIGLDNEEEGVIDTDYTLLDTTPLTAGRHDAKKRQDSSAAADKAAAEARAKAQAEGLTPAQVGQAQVAARAAATSPPEAPQAPQEPSEPPATTKAPEQPPEQPEAPPKRKRGRPRKVQPEPTPEPEPESEPEQQAPEGAPAELTTKEMCDEIQDAIEEDQIPFQTVKVICNEIGIDPFEFKAASAENIKTLHERTVGVMEEEVG